MSKKTSSGVIVKSGTEYLMCHSTKPDFTINPDDGYWSFPKGVVEPGEDFETTAYREFYEETNCDLKAMGFPLIYLGLVESKNKRYVAYLVNDDGRLRNFDFKCLSLIDHDRIYDLYGKPELDSYYWATIEECRERASISTKQVYQLEGLL